MKSPPYIYNKGLDKSQHTPAKSSPIILNDGTFLQAGDTGILYRLDIETGDTLWAFAQKRISSKGYHSTPCVVYGVEVDLGTFNPNATISSSDAGTDTFVVENQKLQKKGKKDLVIIGSYAGELTALNLETGLQVWENAKDVGQHIGASPACSHTAVYISVEFSDPKAAGGVCKVDIKSGKKIWCQFEMKSHSHSSPGVDLQRGIVVAGSNDKHLYVYRESTGDLLAKYPAGGEVKGPILLHKGVAVFGSWGRKLMAFNLNEFDIRKWDRGLDLDFVGGAQQRDDVTIARDLASGEPEIGEPVAYWLRDNGVKQNSSVSSNLDADGAFQTTKWVMAGAAIDERENKIYFADYAGYVRCLDFDTGNLCSDQNGWEPFKPFKSKSYILSSPVVTRNAILVGSSDGWLYALNKKNLGQIFWKFWEGRTGRITSTPMISDVVFDDADEGKSPQNGFRYIIFSSASHSFVPDEKCKSQPGSLHVLKVADSEKKPGHEELVQREELYNEEELYNQA